MLYAASLSTIKTAQFTCFAEQTDRQRVKLLSRVWLFATLWTVARQAPLLTEFSREEYWSGLSCPPPGDFPTKGSNQHLLQFLHESEDTQLCPTLCNAMDCSPLGAPVHGIFQAKILGWVAIFSSRESSWPRDQTRLSCVSCCGGWILYHWAPWEPSSLKKVAAFSLCPHTVFSVCVSMFKFPLLMRISIVLH